MRTALGLKNETKKYEALSIALKKWLLILRIENVLVIEFLLKERTLKFANELNIEGFRALERWLKNEKKKCV